MQEWDYSHPYHRDPYREAWRWYHYLIVIGTIALGWSIVLDLGFWLGAR